MNIDNAIRRLEQMKKEGTQNVIAAAWDSRSFNLPEGENWASLAKSIQNAVDWDSIQDNIFDMISSLSEE